MQLLPTARIDTHSLVNQVAPADRNEAATPSCLETMITVGNDINKSFIIADLYNWRIMHQSEENSDNNECQMMTKSSRGS